MKFITLISTAIMATAAIAAPQGGHDVQAETPFDYLKFINSAVAHVQQRMQAIDPMPCPDVYPRWLEFRPAENRPINKPNQLEKAEVFSGYLIKGTRGIAYHTTLINERKKTKETKFSRFFEDRHAETGAYPRIKPEWLSGGIGFEKAWTIALEELLRQNQANDPSFTSVEVRTLQETISPYTYKSTDVYYRFKNEQWKLQDGKKYIDVRAKTGEILQNQ